MEAKKFQALAEAFKQHDIERETIVQKKVFYKLLGIRNFYH